MKIYILKAILFAALLTSTLQAAQFSTNSIPHIKERHWYNAKPSTPTSHFNKGMTVQKLDQLAAKTIRKGISYISKNGNGNSVHEYTFQKPIGKTTNGKPARTLRVVLNPGGEIVTAFPIK